MSEESGEPKPRKLKLSSSRNQSEASPSEASTPEASTPEASTPATPTPEIQPKVQLKPTSAEETSTPVAAPPAPELTPPADELTPPAPELTPPADELTPPPLQQPAPTPTPTPTTPPPLQPPTPAPKDNPLGSILIVIGLLCILAAAAGGIWYLLQSDASETTDDAAKAVSAEAAPRNPIERAKATIDSVPEHALDAVLEAPQVANATTEPTAPPPEVAPAEQLKEAISEYLQNVHIGGVRTGARARIMLNGQNYDINDTVDATTGLKFIGTRQQKLLFTDPNGVTYVKSF
jgi:hypothetical protein